MSIARYGRLVCTVWIWGLALSGLAMAQESTPAAAETVAESQDPPGYAELIDAAMKEYDQGHFQEALALFTKAHELFPNARTMRVLGMVEFELRNYLASAAYLEEALTSTVRPLSEGLRREAEGLLGRARGFLVILKLYVEPAGASVRIDGQPVDSHQSQSTGPAVETVRLAAGAHELDVSAQGYDRQSRRLELHGGEEQSVRFTLHRSSSDSERPLRRNPWLWTGVSAVVIGAAIGTLLALQQRDPGTTPADGGSTRAVLVGPNNGDER